MTPALLIDGATSVAPAPALSTPPFLIVPVKDSVPLETSTRPSFVGLDCTGELPPPADFRNVPPAATSRAPALRRLTSPTRPITPPCRTEIQASGDPPWARLPALHVTVPSTSNRRPVDRIFAAPSRLIAALAATRVVPGPDIVPPVQLDELAPDPRSSIVPDPPSVPPVCVSSTIQESSAVSVGLSVPPLSVSPPSTWSVCTASAPTLCTTAKVAAMHTWSAGPGSTSGFQFAATFQAPLPPPPSKEIVQGGASGCGSPPNGIRASTRGATVSSPFFATYATLLTPQ